ncbi:hypothetical protein QVD17_07042 [Tagetes erecta]|uniref:Uncharacterized protein n=1 Tax=Tagetes erecta TaxID=13708 RepID=A0AAD8LLE8_TARER|nr:hypothetical protein QVD17_07042 [Tagetes erecta]
MPRFLYSVLLAAEDLLMKSFSEGADDPNWIHTFIFDALCARNVILRIKIDEYNLAPNYGRRFTLSKYFDDDIDSLTKQFTMSGVGTKSNHPACVVPDITEVDETKEMYSRITQDEWDMSDELLWGPRISSQKSTTLMPSVVPDNVNETEFVQAESYDNAKESKYVQAESHDNANESKYVLAESPDNANKRDVQPESHDANEGESVHDESTDNVIETEPMLAASHNNGNEIESVQVVSHACFAEPSTPEIDLLDGPDGKQPTHF